MYRKKAHFNTDKAAIEKRLAAMAHSAKTMASEMRKLAANISLHLGEPEEGDSAARHPVLRLGPFHYPASWRQSPGGNPNMPESACGTGGSSFG